MGGRAADGRNQPPRLGAASASSMARAANHAADEGPRCACEEGPPERPFGSGRRRTGTNSGDHGGGDGHAEGRACLSRRAVQGAGLPGASRLADPPIVPVALMIALGIGQAFSFLPIQAGGFDTVPQCEQDKHHGDGELLGRRRNVQHECTRSRFQKINRCAHRAGSARQDAKRSALRAAFCALRVRAPPTYAARYARH